ncbi:hypothetical protein CIB48_g892 [Xylaria polymorpha]|nr:hypothetical protein CIB48_g892 [Xylaria polymorpha]
MERAMVANERHVTMLRCVPPRDDMLTLVLLYARVLGLLVRQLSVPPYMYHRYTEQEACQLALPIANNFGGYLGTYLLDHQLTSRYYANALNINTYIKQPLTLRNLTAYLLALRLAACCFDYGYCAVSKLLADARGPHQTGPDQTSALIYGLHHSSTYTSSYLTCSTSQKLRPDGMALQYIHSTSPPKRIASATLIAARCSCLPSPPLHLVSWCLERRDQYQGPSSFSPSSSRTQPPPGNSCSLYSCSWTAPANSRLINRLQRPESTLDGFAGRRTLSRPMVLTPMIDPTISHYVYV